RPAACACPPSRPADDLTRRFRACPPPRAAWWRVPPSGAPSRGLAETVGSRAGSSIRRGSDGSGRLPQPLVPRSGEAAFRAVSGKRTLLPPFTAWQLVVDLEPVAVGVREVDAERDGMVGHADVHALVQKAVVHLLQVLERRHPPRDVIQTD